MSSDHKEGEEEVRYGNLYLGLLEGDDIRLITILPSDGPDDAVYCTIDHYDISKNSYTAIYAESLLDTALPPTISGTENQDVGGRSAVLPATSNLPDFRFKWGDFMALSYTWGDPTVRRQIYVSDTPFEVTENLEACLKVLRKTSYMKAGWKIWIDAICINQQDIIERASQVPRMRHIYSQAWTPVVWLGSASENSDQAIEVISKLAADSVLYKHVGDLVEKLKKNPKAYGDGAWLAIHDLALRRYWSRVWILQEASMGKSSMPVLCGDLTIPWDDIFRAFKLLNTSDEIFNVYMTNELAHVGRTLDLAVYEAVGIVEEIEKYRRDEEAKTQTRDLFPLINVSRSAFATDPRDKIYGLLSLIPESLMKRIRPDYRAPVEAVYTDFTVLAIDTTQSLDILRHAGEDASMPSASWIPDWRTNHILGSLGDTPHKASGNATMQVSYPQPDQIACQGIVFDVIDGLGCTWRDGWPAASVHQTVGRANPYGSFEGARDAIWRTMVANRDIEIEDLKDDYSSLLAVPAIVKAQSSLVGELETLASSHLASYCDGFCSGNADFIVAGEPFSRYLISQPNFDAIDVPVLRNALVARDRINLYRRLYTTSKGYVGIALQNVQPGDKICILFGCSMPMVLREVDGGLKLICECYLHGIMDGEALDMIQHQGVTVEKIVINR